MKTKGFIYLASPYFIEHASLREARFKCAVITAGEMMKVSLLVFSPIVHSHYIEMFCGFSGDGDFWLRQDFAILKHASGMSVLKLSGWEESEGIKEEIKFCKKNKISIVFRKPSKKCLEIWTQALKGNQAVFDFEGKQ